MSLVHTVTSSLLRKANVASSSRSTGTLPAISGFRRVALAVLTSGLLQAGSSVAAGTEAPRVQVQAVVDAFCGAPRLRLPLSPDQDQASVLEAADDLFGSEWQPLIQLAPGSGHHDWMDSEARSRARRFYRMRQVSRPPLLQMPNFRLTDHLGESHELFREGDARGVVLVATSAATLAADWSALRPLAAAGATNGMVYWMLAPTDARSAVAAAAAAAGVTVPVLDDDARLVTRSYGITRAGEAVAIDWATATVFYRGAVEEDCNPGSASAARTTPLADAVTRFLSDRSPAVEFVRSTGPALALGTPKVADYRTEIAPLLREKCQTCHRPGDIGSWAITNHASVADRTFSIRANLMEGLMPPWHADPSHGAFENDMNLSPAERETLVGWLDAGAPRGVGADPLAEPAGQPGTWPLGTPDLVLRLPRQNIPARGEVPYSYLFVTNSLPTNRWIRAAAVRPGNPSVVHHALVFQVVPGTLSQMLAQVNAIQGGLAGYFAAFVPGMKQSFYPPDTGKLLAGRGILVFQMHYTPNGTATTDASEIGLYLSDRAPASELKTSAAYNTAIDIQPGQKDYRIQGERTFATAVDVRELSPHMHYRGNSMRFEAVLPDGSVRTLLNVPKYDFAWQALYRLAEPVRLPAGSRLRIQGTFDNSRWNPFNPNAASRVGFGEQTDDEMFIGYVNYTEAR